MKKIFLFTLIFTLIFSLTISAADKDSKTKPQPPQTGQRHFGRTVFGISRSDYEKLNLSKNQKTKIEALNKKYRNSFKPGEKPDLKKMATQNEEKNKAFRGLLTDTQKKQYDQAVSKAKKERKERTAKRYNQMAEELNFTADQKTKLKSILSNNSDQRTINEKFISLLSKTQKEKLKKQMEKKMKGTNGIRRPTGDRKKGNRK